jgi:hypothetical protein
VTDDELRQTLFDIIHSNTSGLVDYRLLHDAVRASDVAANDIIEMLKEKGILA